MRDYMTDAEIPPPLHQGFRFPFSNTTLSRLASTFCWRSVQCEVLCLSLTSNLSLTIETQPSIPAYLRSRKEGKVGSHRQQQFFAADSVTWETSTVSHRTSPHVTSVYLLVRVLRLAGGEISGPFLGGLANKNL